MIMFVWRIVNYVYDGLIMVAMDILFHSMSNAGKDRYVKAWVDTVCDLTVEEPEDPAAAAA